MLHIWPDILLDLAVCPSPRIRVTRVLFGTPRALAAVYRVSLARNFSKYNAVKIQRQATLTKSWIMQRLSRRVGRKGRKEKWVTDSGGGKVPPLSSGSSLVTFSLAPSFSSLRPLHRAHFFHLPFSFYNFPPTPIVSFSLRRTESSARVSPFSHHSLLL